MTTYLLGLEYSEERIKCSLLKRGSKSFDLHALQNFEGDGSRSPLEQLALWKTENIGSEQVKAVVSVSESLVFFKELTVPNVKKEALDEAIYWELSENSPIPPSEAIYEWSELSRKKDEVKVSAMAIREATILNISQKLEEAGIIVIAFEPSSISLARATVADYSKNTMLLMVGEHETDIVVMKSGKPVFSTTADVHLLRSKGEKWRLDDDVSHEIAQKTRDLIEFWEGKNDDKIQQVIITGDLVDKYFGLAQNINEFASIPVNIARQRKITGITLGNLAKAIVNRYFVSIGAAARFLGDIYEDVNLIPKDKKVKVASELSEKLKLKRLGTINRYFTIFAGILALLVVGYFILSSIYDNSIKNTLEAIAAHPGQKLVSQVKETNDYLSKIHELIGKHRNLAENFGRIADLTPKEIRLSKIEYADDKNQAWIIRGVGSREAILSYFDKLEKESGSKKVTMPYSNLNADLENDFEINILW
jgi:hypothetical protein